MRRLKNILAGLFISATALAVADDNSPIIAAGDIVSLTNELAKSTSSRTIYLSPGEYDVSVLTNAPMYHEKYFGYALLRSRKARIRSLSGKRDDVIIKSCNSGIRILALEKNGSLHDVTVTGGYAGSKTTSSFNHRVGGAVLLVDSSAVVSNCVFYGNKSDADGGAVGAPYGYEHGKVYDSVFYGNNEATGLALAATRTTLFRCTITNNVGVGVDSTSKEIYVINRCKIYDSYIADNAAAYGGGARGGCAVNCRFVNNRQYTPYGYHWGNSGGGAARDVALTNCYFYGNSAYRFGGAIRGGTVYKCEVISNRTMYSASVEACGGGIYNATLVDNCTVASNYTAGVGGGVDSCGKVIDSDLVYNCAAIGGGVANSTAEKCTIAHNVATSRGDDEIGGSGGGIYGGSAINCTIADNSSSSYSCNLLKGCDISGSRINAKTIDGCVIHEVVNGPVRHAYGNVRYPDGYLSSNMYMIVVRDWMRNCLVTNCNWRSLSGSFINPAMFTPYGTMTARVENCTFADNGNHLLARFFRPDNGKNHPVAFVNCVFTGNRTYLGSSTKKDIETFSCSQLVLSNCVYGVLASMTPRVEGFEDSGCIELGANGNPRFVTWEDQPRYSPKRVSPLRGAGLLLDWMGETAVDLSGRPRVRDGKVDVGCYQYWFEPVGMSLKVR